MTTKKSHQGLTLSLNNDCQKVTPMSHLKLKQWLPKSHTKVSPWAQIMIAKKSHWGLALSSNNACSKVTPHWAQTLIAPKSHQVLTISSNNDYHIYSNISREIYGKIICKSLEFVLYPREGLKQNKKSGARACPIQILCDLYTFWSALVIVPPS